MYRFSSFLWVSLHWQFQICSSIILCKRIHSVSRGGLGSKQEKKISSHKPRSKSDKSLCLKKKKNNNTKYKELSDSESTTLLDAAVLFPVSSDRHISNTDSQCALGLSPRENYKYTPTTRVQKRKKEAPSSFPQTREKTISQQCQCHVSLASG
jgi:hypothetical protein